MHKDVIFSNTFFRCVYFIFMETNITFQEYALNRSGDTERTKKGVDKKATTFRFFM
jgi:hypothetical protein